VGYLSPAARLITVQMPRTTTAKTTRERQRSRSSAPVATTTAQPPIEAQLKEVHAQIARDLKPLKNRIDVALEAGVPTHLQKRLSTLGKALARLVDRVSALAQSPAKQR
jgi:hypothetical protein